MEKGEEDEMYAEKQTERSNFHLQQSCMVVANGSGTQQSLMAVSRG